MRVEVDQSGKIGDTQEKVGGSQTRKGNFYWDDKAG
jgi:hypothetical protein